jgi:hypothetical protein
MIIQAKSKKVLRLLQCVERKLEIIPAYTVAILPVGCPAVIWWFFGVSLSEALKEFRNSEERDAFKELMQIRVAVPSSSSGPQAHVRCAGRQPVVIWIQDGIGHPKA